MSDPVEEALRAIEAKYYPAVLEGKSLMPSYPREDVAVLIEAAVKAERKACQQVTNDLYDAIDRDPDDYLGKGRHSDSWKMACTAIGSAIHARNKS